MSERKSSTCTVLVQAMGIPHDSGNWFLLRESYKPKDLFSEAQKLLNVVDDTTLNKPYNQEMELVARFYSDKHHRMVNGLSLVTASW